MARSLGYTVSSERSPRLVASYDKPGHWKYILARVLMGFFKLFEKTGFTIFRIWILWLIRVIHSVVVFTAILILNRCMRVLWVWCFAFEYCMTVCSYDRTTLFKRVFQMIFVFWSYICNLHQMNIYIHISDLNYQPVVSNHGPDFRIYMYIASSYTYGRGSYILAVVCYDAGSHEHMLLLSNFCWF